MTKGHVDGYKDNGVKALEICVSFDERTCADCESMDREVVKSKKLVMVVMFRRFIASVERCTVIPITDYKEGEY